MNTPFQAGYRITQLFGARPEYYQQFGLKAHEGVDLIPADANWDMLCVEDGVVVRELDDQRLSTGSIHPYGIHVVLFNRESGRSWWYCHLAENNVSMNQVLKRGDKIGKMGNTGNTEGPHLHLGLRYADANGNPINLDNGFKGFVDPLPVLKDLNLSIPTPAPVPKPAPAPVGAVNFAKVVWSLEEAARILEREKLLAERDYIVNHYLADAIQLRNGK